MVNISSGAFIFLAIFPLNHAAPYSHSFWMNPPEGGSAPPQLTWIVGEQQNLSWFSRSGETYNIILVQEVVPSTNDGSATIHGPFSNIGNLTSLVWTVQLYQFDLSASNLFFFWANSGRPDVASSTYFNIANNQSGSSSATTASALDSATATTLSSSTTLPSISTIQSPTSSSSPSPGPNGTTIGAREGLGIGIPILIGIVAIAFVLLNKVKSKKPQKQNPENISRLPYQQQQTIRLPVEINGDFPHMAENPGYQNSLVELPANI